MLEPFTQGSVDRSGLGLGLSIARRTVETNDGSLTVLDFRGWSSTVLVTVTLAAACTISATRVLFSSPA